MKNPIKTFLNRFHATDKQKDESKGKQESTLLLINTQWLIALGFFGFIIVGALLLLFPFAVEAGQPRLSVTEAFFTATSATCETGLSVIDVGTRLSTTGQIILMIMIQLGGLGITTFGTFLLVLVGQRLSIQSESIIMDAYGAGDVDILRKLICKTVGLTIFLELLGASALYYEYTSGASGFEPYPPLKAAYYSIFHSVSAFCNAGFSLHSQNLIPFQSCPLYLCTISLLIIAGGLGFLVLVNLISIRPAFRKGPKKHRLNLHSKIVLFMTALLVSAGALLILGNEWNASLKELDIGDKIMCSIFQSVTARTAGFNAVDMSEFTESSRFVTSLLMLVGGSPGSAAGGIRTTTVLVIFMTLYSMTRGRNETIVFSRTLSNQIVRQSFLIVLAAFLLIFLSYGVLLHTEQLQPGDASKLIFETISASATVGLSINHTATLSTAGRWVIIFCMFMGRLGAVAIIAFLTTRKEDANNIRYPEEGIVVG